MDNNSTAFVGSIPDYYDRGLGPVIFADYAAYMARRAAAFGPSRVLETAAGTGIVSRELRDRLPADTEFTATDLNEPMLAVAKGKFHPDEQVEIRQADAQALPFADGAFDAVVCQFGIMFFPDKPKSFAEAFRVLKPGGRYFFSVWDAHRYNSFARITDALLKQTFPADPPAFYRVPFSCAAIDPIKEMLIEAGFTGIEIEVAPIDKTVADLGLFADGLILGNPVSEQIRARGQVTAEAVRDQVLEALTREFGSNPAIVPLQTIFYSVLKPR